MRLEMTIRTTAAWSLMLVFGVRVAAALDPSPRITQYFHSAWRVQDGAFESAPNAIAQTTDGYIWIGTASGLVKYDGVRFTTWAPPPGKNLASPNVLSLLGSSDGVLWIGTASGLLSWKDNELRELLGHRINRIVEDRAGGIWAARSRAATDGGLCKVTGEHAGCMAALEQADLRYSTALAEDAEGNLWVGGPSLLRWREGSLQAYFPEAFAKRLNLLGVESIAAAADGSVWVSIPSENLGLVHFVDGRPDRVRLTGVTTQRFTTLLADRSGSLWLGSSDNGLYRLSGRRVDHFGAADGLSGNTIQGLFEDREGNLWVATSKGLDSFRESRLLTFSSREGLTADVAESVLASRDGTVWVGNRGGLDVIRSDGVTSIPLPGSRVTALFEDHAGRLWVGIDGGLTIYARGQFQPVTRSDGSPLGVTTALTEDREHNIWAVANPDRKLIRIRDLRVEEEFDHPQVPVPRVAAPHPAGGIWLAFPDGFGLFGRGKLTSVPAPQGARSLIPEPDGSVWAATRNGLVRWKDGRTETLTSKNGLPCDLIYSAIRDDHAALWLYSRCGLVGIADSELDRWWRDSGARIQAQVFDVLDGAMPNASTFHPSATKGPDGRIWFVNDSVVQMFDPSRVVSKGPPVPVYIEQVRADRKEYGSRAVRLPPHTRDIEISYTALSYSIPQKVRFRYKLEGRDREWQDVGTRRQAFYTDLSPSVYRFRVTASIGDGVWNPAGDAVEFSIAPALYQTNWFRASVIGAFSIGLWALYQMRLRRLAREFHAQLDGRVDERLRVARELHDTILQSFQASLIFMQAARNLLARGAADATERLDDAIQVAESAVAEGRSAIEGMRAFNSTGGDLAGALQQLGDDLARETGGVKFRVAVEGTPRELHPILQDELYGIAREAIRNAFRHAQATAIEVAIAYTDCLRVRVRDDGKGIDPDVLTGGRPGHYGLPGMRERAAVVRAKLKVWSAPGAGTEIELTVPGPRAYVSSANFVAGILQRRKSKT